MRKTTLILGILLTALACGHKAPAQDPIKVQDATKAETPARFFHVEFVLQEVGTDGKPTNSRSYSGTLSTGRIDKGLSVRTGSRLPIEVGAPSGGAGNEKNMNVQYLDIGVSIDARDARMQGDKLALSLVVEVSSLAGSPSPIGAADPVIRQNKWQAAVLIPIGKSTVVFTSEALESKGGMQFSVAATPLD